MYILDLPFLSSLLLRLEVPHDMSLDQASRVGAVNLAIIDEEKARSPRWGRICSGNGGKLLQG